MKPKVWKHGAKWCVSFPLLALTFGVADSFVAYYNSWAEALDDANYHGWALTHGVEQP